MRYDMTY